MICWIISQRISRYLPMNGSSKSVDIRTAVIQRLCRDISCVGWKFITRWHLASSSSVWDDERTAYLALRNTRGDSRPVPAPLRAIMAFVGVPDTDTGTDPDTDWVLHVPWVAVEVSVPLLYPLCLCMCLGSLMVFSFLNERVGELWTLAGDMTVFIFGSKYWEYNLIKWDDQIADRASHISTRTLWFNDTLP